ncbi:LacI family DNA-binding transcriptional regulator [Nakamurella sp. PAMC28650]|jgi:LacI family transcriptional regulator|uniref:LacI family DNA-binding transcriptional regulator n=1 Tax=Nakamurella sp. PAMC28650 TaxID=2762325 RepID=UPI00164D63D3|nr:LacI family DNA-binding transcriptional regulator [Nakamurella sp. PAMC28650]QNK80773.1 LacI family DNA-binding transcriptional regulator [Nakamurella sp. PAMC28650]
MVQVKAATIRDVAELAGFSVTTVSHVLNDVDGKRIAESTRERIREVAGQLQYRPNKLAQGLRSQRSHTIGFVSDLVATTPYAGQLILGAQEAASAVGSLLLLLSSGGDPALEDRELQALIDRQVDGVVYASMYHRVVDPPARLGDSPAVLLDARTDSGAFTSVVPDEIGGARAAVEELLSHGHRRIGFCTDRSDIPATRARLAGYRQALEVYGIAFDPSLVVAGRGEAEGGFQSAHSLLTRPDRPTGLFCFTDRIAFGAYQAASELGLSVPQDVSIVGFDDQEIISANLRPGLTTMALPHYAMGKWAVESLMRQIDNGPDSPAVHQLMPCPLVRRASVSAPPRG